MAQTTQIASPPSSKAATEPPTREKLNLMNLSAVPDNCLAGFQNITRYPTPTMEDYTSAAYEKVDRLKNQASAQVDEAGNQYSKTTKHVEFFSKSLAATTQRVEAIKKHRQSSDGRTEASLTAYKEACGVLTITEEELHEAKITQAKALSKLEQAKDRHEAYAKRLESNVKDVVWFVVRLMDVEHMAQFRQVMAELRARREAEEAFAAHVRMGVSSPRSACSYTGSPHSTAQSGSPSSIDNIQIDSLYDADEPTYMTYLNTGLSFTQAGSPNELKSRLETCTAATVKRPHEDDGYSVFSVDNAKRQKVAEELTRGDLEQSVFNEHEADCDGDSEIDEDIQALFDPNLDLRN
jgi:ElaB/YqjD/DUF883 family membrane-anchored ribosome-binding protein